MYTYSMKKMYIIIKNQKKIENLEPALSQLRQRGVEVFWAGKPNLFVTPEIESVKDVLILTDISQLASLAAKAGYPVLAYVHEENREESFSPVRYVIEGFEDADGEYFYRVWQRLTEKPWFITETERCIIRETTESDLDAFYRIYSDPSVAEFMEPLFEDREAEFQYVKDYREKVYDFYGFGMWTVLDKETGEVIGRAGVSMREGFEDPELGFVIAKEYQGRGLAYEVCKEVLSFVNKEFEFTVFGALVHPDNLPSKKLLKKLGFTYSETVRIGDDNLQMYYLNDVHFC